MNSNAVCTNLTPYPIAITGAVGTLLAGKPVICGGYSNGQAQSSCYMYNKDSSSWNFHTNMNTRRAYAGSALNDDSLMVIAGYDGSNRFNSMEYIYGDGSKSSGTGMPSGREGHRAVTLHDGRAMIIGASYPSSGSSQSTLTRLVGQIKKWSNVHSSKIFKQLMFSIIISLIIVALLFEPRQL